jgi:hypothetical protein
VHLSSLLYNELVSAAIDQERMMKAVAEADEKKRKRCLDPLVAVILAVLLPSTAWCIPHLGVSCVDHNNSRIWVIAHNSNRNNSSSNNRSNSNNSSSTVPLPHRRNRLSSGHHSSFLPSIFHASTMGRRATSLENAACPSKATRRELRHSW